MRSSVIYIIKLYRAATTTAALQSFRLDFRFIHHLYIYLHVQFLTIFTKPRKCLFSAWQLIGNAIFLVPSWLKKCLFL